MLIIKTSAHVHLDRIIKGFRSCWHATGIVVPQLDLARIAFEEKRLSLRKRRRLWLAGQWWNPRGNRLFGPKKII